MQAHSQHQPIEPPAGSATHVVGTSPAPVRAPNPALAGALWTALAMAAALALLATLVPVFRPYDGTPCSLVGWLGYVWKTNPDSRHGTLVPLIVAWLVWRKRHRLAKLPIQGTWLGVAVAAAGALLFWIGWKGDIHYINFVAFLVILAGMILAQFGTAWFRELLFSCAFLLFAMPMPFLDEMLAFRLRLLMAAVSVSILNLIGVQTVRAGTAIFSAADPSLGLPQGRVFSLDVADPCSGLNSLFALIMLTALYAHLTQHRPWKQWFLFACSLPLAVLGNMTRVTSIAIVAAGIDQEFASGPFHIAAGYLVFVVAIGLMLVIGALLNADWRTHIRRFGRRVPRAGSHASDSY